MNDINDKFDEKMKLGYDEYLKCPLATHNTYSELYSNGWCKLTGRSCIHPHPHRYFTFIEFCFVCGKNEKFNNRFIKDIL